jgi:cytochrome c oxidase assembly protein subunit 15
LGAVVAGSFLIVTGLLVVARSAWPPLRFLGGLLVFAVLLQITIGVAMVHFHLPLPLATLHNGGAAFLVMVMVTLLRTLCPRSLETAPLRAPEPASAMVPLRRVDAPR